MFCNSGSIQEYPIHFNLDRRTSSHYALLFRDIHLLQRELRTAPSFSFKNGILALAGNGLVEEELMDMEYQLALKNIEYQII